MTRPPSSACPWCGMPVGHPVVDDGAVQAPLFADDPPRRGLVTPLLRRTHLRPTLAYV
jgi:hypothetical protein